MAQTNIPNVTIENADIRFRNFSGAEGRFNREGDRNFAVFLDEQLAKDLELDGWNVKYLKLREDADPEDKPQAYLQVAVGFPKAGSKARPPRVVMVTSRGRTTLDEDSVGLLDWAELKNVDLIIRPYHWEVSGKEGIKAYVKSIFLTIAEDELDLKYADVPDSAQNVIGLEKSEFSTEEPIDPPW